jgi:multidrug efflux pump subunit AcrB
MTPAYGLAGRLAAAFINSKLTPLFLIASLALGLLSVIALPREEEPQIIVPMIDVMVQMPGASPAEVEQRVTRPLEKLLWEIPGVEYIYSTSSPGMSMVIVRFYVGQDEEQAIVRLNQKLFANMDVVPPGVSAPMVKPRSIDDVPVMALTLWGPRYSDFELRRVAEQLHDTIKEIPDVSEVTIAGGRTRQVTVELDPARLASYGLDPLGVQRAIQAANLRQRASDVVAGNRSTIVEAGSWIADAASLQRIVVDARGGRSVWLRDVAAVRDEDAEPTALVTHHAADGRSYPAVTISIAKRKGVNAIDLTRRISAKLDTVQGVIVPADLTVTVTRNYGETAAHKSNELLWHMFLAIVSVSVLIWLTLGKREAAVVAVAIPVTLALTLFVFYVYGYTLNRITLFALIFSIGILVDDAIVVVENIVRHARLAGKGHDMSALAVKAVDEVGNPTILATLTVIAAILPMAFVGGLMGPYMRPIPVGATAAMVFSLIVAFIATPWASRRLLSKPGHSDHGGEDRLTRYYRSWMSRLIAEPRLRVIFLASVAGLLLAAVAMVPLKLVTVKMLPFDDKSEFQVIINMPDGTPLEETARVTGLLAQEALKQASVTTVQSYVGTASPYNFNGLVRHYFMRRASHHGDLQVNLQPKDERSEQSHAIAKRVRTALLPIAAKAGARIQVAEVPPGPPVLQTLVAEVYGPDPTRRMALASQVRDIFAGTDGVVDVDWYVETPQPKVTLEIDPQKSMAAGVPPAAVAAVVRMVGAGDIVGIIHDEHARADVPILLRLPRSDRGSLDAIRAVRVAGGAGTTVAVGELTTARETLEPASLYHKNMQPVTYVLGDVAGRFESPVYAILQMNQALKAITLPEGYGLEVRNASLPFDTTKYAMKWDGEWHITYEVFRDLGLAFAAALLLIYILVVGWFQSFLTPVIIMVSIPFSLIGILPAHAAMGAFFTATSMIGFIAGAGIVVRNSIILVDFVELRVREGMPLADAVIDAGAVRFRPIALTAAAVIVGAGVILFDPIFQGLAISLMAGSVASLILAPATVPVLAYIAMSRQEAKAASSADDTQTDARSRDMWAYPPRSILVAVDFGAASIRALRVAQTLAVRHGATVTALHAETVDVPPYFTHDQMAEVEEHRAADRRDAEAYLAEFTKQYAPAAVPRLIEGPAVATLLAAATQYDLLILGTHGRRGAGRWWLGSVAERVVRDAAIPTLVVRADQSQDDEARIFTHPVVVDGPEFSGEARRYASGLAGTFGGVVGDKTVASMADLTCSPDATLMAVAIGPHQGGAWFGDAAERLVRQCQLPMLFVPNRG